MKNSCTITWQLHVPKKRIKTMNKKIYMKPTMNVVKIQHQAHLLSGSIDSVNSNAGITIGGGGGGPARARSHGGDWDDWDE